MKTKPRNKHPSWLVKRRLTRIRNRYAHFLKSLESDQIHDNNYTWAECYHKAKGKLYYRFNNWMLGAQNNDDWMVALAFIKTRFIKYFDNEFAWRIAEYTALEKINKQVFHRIKSPSLIWHKVAVDKAGRANKLFKQKPKRRLRTKKYNWEDVIGNSKIRMDNRDPKAYTESELFWRLCLKANYEKIRSRIRWFDWNSCIQRNYYKLR
ncbi:MAG: hypothetical protein ACHQXJ_02600 [Nitrososphaerales archaeon]